jgi:hypothetical protein
LGRPGNARGLHELKVMRENGSRAQLLDDVDVADIGTAWSIKMSLLRNPIDFRVRKRL